MKRNIFRTLRHQDRETSNDMLNDHVVESVHDDFFEITDSSPTHPERGWGQKLKDKKKTTVSKKKEVKAEPVVCSPDSKVESFDKATKKK